jgi:uncharacterized protein YceK
MRELMVALVAVVFVLASGCDSTQARSQGGKTGLSSASSASQTSKSGTSSARKYRNGSSQTPTFKYNSSSSSTSSWR